MDGCLRAEDWYGESFAAWLSMDGLDSLSNMPLLLSVASLVILVRKFEHGVLGVPSLPSDGEIAKEIFLAEPLVGSAGLVGAPGIARSSASLPPIAGENARDTFCDRGVAEGAVIRLERRGPSSQLSLSISIGAEASDKR